MKTTKGSYNQEAREIYDGSNNRKEHKMSTTETHKIRVTDCKQTLSRVWSRGYADSHAGETYNASIDADGWATTDVAKFPPNCYEFTP